MRTKRIPGKNVAGIHLLPAFLALWTVLWVSPALAEITFKPILSTAARYDTNFYGLSTHERSVYTLMASPGLQATLGMPNTTISLAYSAEITRYLDSSTVPENQKDASDMDYIGHLIALNMRHHMTRRLVLGLDDGFYITRYPYYYDRLSTLTVDRRYSVNRLSPMAFYDVSSRLTAGARYVRTDVTFKEDDSNDPRGPYSLIGDSGENRGIFTLNYDLTRTTTLEADYHVWKTSYDGSADDVIGNQLMLGGEVRYRFYSFNAGAGFSIQDSKAPDVHNATAFVYRVGITGQSPPPPERRRDEGMVFIRPLNHFHLGAVRSYNSYGDRYLADRFILSIGSLFLERINCQARGWYQVSNYEDANDRKDRTYDISLSPSYLFTDALNLSLTGGYQRSESNLDGNDFTNWYGIISLNFNFDLSDRAGFAKEALFYWW